MTGIARPADLGAVDKPRLVHDDATPMAELRTCGRVGRRLGLGLPLHGFQPARDRYGVLGMARLERVDRLGPKLRRTIEDDEQLLLEVLGKFGDGHERRGRRLGLDGPVASGYRQPL